MDEKKSAIELIEAAQVGKIIKVDFDFPLGDGKSLPVSFHAPDRFQIQRIQDVNYKAEFAVYEDKGLHLRPINEKKWKESIEEQRKKLIEGGASKAVIKNTIKSIEDEKPENQADEGALRFSKIFTSREVLPLFLRDQKTGRKLFKTPDEQRRFKDIIASDMSLMELLLRKYMELANLLTETTEQAKNSSRGDDSESGKPETQSQEDTDSPHGPKKSTK